MQAAKTSAIISAIIAEMQVHPECPILIAGNLNAEPANIPAFSKLKGKFSFLDLGAVADTFGQPTHQPTCIAPSSLQATRRDFMFASPSLFAAVPKNEVIFQDETPVHGTLFVQLNFHALPSTTWVARKPTSLRAHLHHTCEQLLGPVWERPCPHQRASCDDDFRGEDAARKQANKAQNSYRQQQHALFQGAFETFLDASLSKASNGLQASLDAFDLNNFWCLFWTTIEDAVACYSQADCATAKQFRGRATQLVRQTKTQRLAHRVLGDAIPSNLPDWLLAIRRQANRCQWMASVLSLRSKPCNASPPKPLTIEFAHAQDKLLKFIRKHLQDPSLLFLGLPQGGDSTKAPFLGFDAKTLLDKLGDPHGSYAARCFALRKAHHDLTKIFHCHVHSLRAARLAVQPPLSMGKRCQQLKPPAAPPCCESESLSQGSLTNSSLTPRRWTRPPLMHGPKSTRATSV